MRQITPAQPWRPSKNDTCRSIREADGQVLRVRSKRPGQGFSW